MADQEQPEQKTISLRKALNLGDQDITEITLREPTGDEVEQFEKEQRNVGDVAASIKLIALVAGIPPKLAKSMGIRDIKEAGEYLAGFMSSGPKTGEN